MSNNYVLFSGLIKYDNKEQRDWLIAKLKAADQEACPECGSAECNNEDHPGPEEGPICNWQDEEVDGKRGIWVYSEESGDTDRLADLVCSFQKHFALNDPWICEFAYTCNKPRIGEFGGSAALCLKGEAHWIVPAHEAEELAKKLALEEIPTP